MSTILAAPATAVSVPAPAAPGTTPTATASDLTISPVFPSGAGLWYAPGAPKGEQTYGNIEATEGLRVGYAQPRPNVQIFSGGALVFRGGLQNKADLNIHGVGLKAEPIGVDVTVARDAKKSLSLSPSLYVEGGSGSGNVRLDGDSTQNVAGYWGTGLQMGVMGNRKTSDKWDFNLGLQVYGGYRQQEFTVRGEDEITLRRVGGLATGFALTMGGTHHRNRVESSDSAISPKGVEFFEP